MVCKSLTFLFVFVCVQLSLGCPLSNSVGLYQNNLGLVQNSLGYVPQALSVAPCGGYNGVSYPGSVLSVSSGSCATPNGISILAENLEMVGTVGVNGAAPFLGSVFVNGALPTAGQAAVSYSTNSGVGLTSGGCGQGLAGPAVLNEVVVPGFVGSNLLNANLCYSNVFNGNLLSSNLLAPASGVYLNSPCGCF